ncbi:protein TIC 21, chloroplastic-like [Oryza brachyantha]|uniref:protein TIC 21, chloroplastic-like n=1 Tax=Oryza brachyantha TaxID=4533 RepID=UPI001ADAC702|nr:protein TIC 21, chloroplastic-like [Oryza brachyantha]
MQALLLSPAAAPRPPLPTLRRPSLPSGATPILAPAPRASAPRAAAALPAGRRGGRASPHLAAAAAAAAAPDPTPSPAEDEVERAKLAQVSKRLETTARYFKTLGTLGFWSQLVCTTVSAGILSFSAVATGNATSPLTFFATSIGVVAAFISVFWAFGYIRLSERLKRTANEPTKAPPRADVVRNLKNGIVLNIIGMGAAILGMQATVGALVAKALTTSAVPYYQGIPPGQSPVLALDVFLVQASANTILSHFLGLSSTLELLRSVTLTKVESAPAPPASMSLS